jgi:hypothetical protein
MNDSSFSLFDLARESSFGANQLSFSENYFSANATKS